jgi:hypothetical protein
MRVKTLNQIAQKLAIIVAWADPIMLPPIQGELFKDTAPEGDGKKPQPPIPDRRLHYNVTWNMVYDLGAEPNIRIIEDGGYAKTFENEGAAIDFLRQLKPFEDEYLPVFKDNLAPYLSKNTDGTVTYRRGIKSYILWWKPVPTEE